MNPPNLHKIVELQRKAMDVASKRKRPYYIEVERKKILCLPNVNPPQLDSKLLAHAVTVKKNELVLDAFSGTGIVAVVVAPMAKRVIAADMSDDAIKNILANIRKHGLEGRVSAIQCDIFPPLQDKFDVIALNPPYTDHSASTILQRAVWDEKHATLIQFFRQVHHHLSFRGRIYISWANFADFDWLEKIAQNSGFRASIKSQAKEFIGDFMTIKNVKSVGGEQIVYRIYELKVS